MKLVFKDSSANTIQMENDSHQNSFNQSRPLKHDKG